MMVQPPGVLPKRHPLVALDYLEHVERLDYQGDTVDVLSEKLYLRIFDSLHDPYKVTKNRFPYAISGDSHRIFWINPRYETIYTEAKVGHILECLGYTSAKWICYQNPVEFRSVPGIPHYHLLPASSLPLL